jgi:hypothetical protein
MIIIHKQVRVWKEAIMTYLKVLSSNFSEKTDEKHKKRQPGLLIAWIPPTNTNPECCCYTGAVF